MIRPALVISTLGVMAALGCGSGPGSAAPAGLLGAGSGSQGGGGSGTSTACVATPPGQWVATSTANAPTPSDRLLTIWTGKLLVIFSATDGSVFDPCANSWRRASIDGMPPQLPEYNTSLPYAPVVAGDRIVVLFPATTGNLAASASTVAAAVYDLVANRWTTLPLGGTAPAPRDGAAVVWTGTEIIVWGGSVESAMGTTVLLGDGARLDPQSGRWTPMAGALAPAPRMWAGAQWTGSRFVVLGGNTQEASPNTCDPNGPCDPAAPGGTYDPVTDSWAAHPNAGAPVLGPYPIVIWNGTSMVVWQNALPGGYGIYNPSDNRWEAMPDPSGLLSSATRPYHAWLDGDRLVVVESYDAAAVLSLSTATWAGVPPAQLPHTTGGYALPILGDADRLLPMIGRATASITTPSDVQGGWIGSIDAQQARWEVAPLPVTGSPPSIIGTMAWTGQSLVVWGGSTTVLDPTGSNGCSNPTPGFGCDPVTPTKTVYGTEGGLLVPVFASAPLR
jgi:hypothetical protein